MIKGLNDQVSEFRTGRILGEYPILWVDALYEKVWVDGKVVSMAVMVVCGVDRQGKRDVLAVEPMFDESGLLTACCSEAYRNVGLPNLN